MGPAGKGGAGQLITQTLIILGGLGVGRVIYDADPVSRGRRHRDAVTDLSLEYSGIQLFRHLLGELQHFPIEIQPGIKTSEQNAHDPQAGIIILPHTVNGLFDLGDAQQAEYLRRHGNDQAVSGDIGVDGQNIKGGRSVDDDEIISVLEL